MMVSQALDHQEMRDLARAWQETAMENVVGQYSEIMSFKARSF
jgi:hypothetical protein